MDYFSTTRLYVVDFCINWYKLKNILISMELKSKFDFVFEFCAVPSGDHEFRLVEPMSASFRPANKRKRK